MKTIYEGVVIHANTDETVNATKFRRYRDTAMTKYNHQSPWKSTKLSKGGVTRYLGQLDVAAQQSSIVATEQYNRRWGQPIPFMTPWTAVYDALETN